MQKKVTVHGCGWLHTEEKSSPTPNMKPAAWKPSARLLAFLSKKKNHRKVTVPCPFSQVSGYTQLNTACTWGQMTASSFFTLLCKPNSFGRESSCSTCTSAYSWSGLFCSWLSCAVLMNKQGFLRSNPCERTREWKFRTPNLHLIIWEAVGWNTYIPSPWKD